MIIIPAYSAHLRKAHLGLVAHQNKGQLFFSWNVALYCINLETVVNLSCLLIYQKSFVTFRIIYRRKRQPSGRGAFAIMTVRCQSVIIHNICHNLYIKIAASKSPRKYSMKREDGSVCLK